MSNGSASAVTVNVPDPESLPPPPDTSALEVTGSVASAGGSIMAAIGAPLLGTPATAPIGAALVGGGVLLGLGGGAASAKGAADRALKPTINALQEQGLSRAEARQFVKLAGLPVDQIEAERQTAAGRSGRKARAREAAAEALLATIRRNQTNMLVEQRMRLVSLRARRAALLRLAVLGLFFLLVVGAAVVLRPNELMRDAKRLWDTRRRSDLGEKGAW